MARNSKKCQAWYRSFSRDDYGVFQGWDGFAQESRRAGTLRLQQLEAEVEVAEKELERVRSEVSGLFPCRFGVMNEDDEALIVSDADITICTVRSCRGKSIWSVQ